jgi:hypothetical protein
MGSQNNGYRGEKKEIVTLTCGCTRRVWDKPRPGSKFACPNGLGHGYRLDWVKAESTESGWHTTNQDRKKS